LAQTSAREESVEAWFRNFRPGYGVYFLKDNGQWGYAKMARWSNSLRTRVVLEVCGMPRGEEIYFRKKVVPTREVMKMFRFN